MSRTPATIHINENLHSNNFEDPEVVNSAHEHFYNYVPGSDYDGGFFYGGLGGSGAPGIDLSVFASRSNPVQSTFGGSSAFG
jgi:hypothetical protein